MPKKGSKDTTPPQTKEAATAATDTLVKDVTLPAGGGLQPRLLPVGDGWDPSKALKVTASKNPLKNSTLGDFGLAAQVGGPDGFPPTMLIMPYNPDALTGIDGASARAFRVDEKAGTFTPVWNSGINLGLDFVWAEITRPGNYVAIGLPRDRLLQGLIRTVARQRLLSDVDTQAAHHELTARVVAPLQQVNTEQFDKLRRLVTLAEVQTGVGPRLPRDVRRGKGGHILPYPLPGDLSLEEFTKQLSLLKTPLGGLPEEALLNTPEDLDRTGLPWATAPGSNIDIDPGIVEKLGGITDITKILPFPICWLFSQDWWMYHHDENHTGVASGCSGIRSTSVGSLILRHTTTVSGTIVSHPAIVQGKIYIGTTEAEGQIPNVGGVLYRINLVTGAIEKSFNVPTRFPSYTQGIGCTPAVVNGRVYFTAVPGWVYCLDANTFAQIWRTDLRFPDAAHNQPVKNHDDPGNPADSWSSPLVVNGRVYVGSGEGEGNTFGFVFCLDANTGDVIWLFCTNKFTPASDNNPNVIPLSAVGINPVPAGFTSHADPPQRGASIWSSLAYDAGLNRVFTGTGNATESPLPDAFYGSGALALDATTGQFRGYFQPSPGDGYYPGDSDIDVPAGPTLFTRGGTRVLAIGSKSGAFFLLDPATMNPLARRQLLPKDAVTNAQLPNIDPGGAGGGENAYGIFATAAVDFTHGRLFVGLGGYSQQIDTPTTPFMRAVDWNTLADAWPTAVFPIGGHQVSKYTVPVPPMYTNTGEVGLGSPAVVNDVVFVSTGKPGLYALHTSCGLCLWSAPGLGGLPAGSFILGPAVSGDWVVVGCANAVKAYSFPLIIWPWPLPFPIPIPQIGPIPEIGPLGG